MATYTKFQSFVEALAEKVHNLATDTLKVALTNTAPAATNTVFAPGGAHPPPAATDGYTAGGHTTAQVSSAQTAGTYKLVLTDLVFTAGVGTIGPFRYVILYNDTATNDELIAYYDHGSSVTLLATETFTVDFDATNGVLQLA